MESWHCLSFLKILSPQENLSLSDFMKGKVFFIIFARIIKTAQKWKVRQKKDR